MSRTVMRKSTQRSEPGNETIQVSRVSPVGHSLQLVSGIPVGLRVGRATGAASGEAVELGGAARGRRARRFRSANTASSDNQTSVTRDFEPGRQFGRCVRAPEFGAHFRHAFVVAADFYPLAHRGAFGFCGRLAIISEGL